MEKYVDALVLKTSTYRESDLLLTVFTREFGKINVRARGAKRSKKGRLYGDLYSYSKMRIFFGKGIPVVCEAELIQPFYLLRTDMEKLSLAGYFCEVASLIPYETTDEELLKLLLNSLYMLSEESFQDKIVKIVFEMKYAKHEGFAPETSECVICGKCASVWNFSEGFLCRNCAADTGFSVSEGMRKALSHILDNDNKSAYRFSLNVEALNYLSDLTEKYLQFHLDTNFEALEYYKKFNIEHQ